MKLLRSIYHWILSWTGSVFYGKPSREMFVIGVTGTKGKSTTLEMINTVLKKAGKKTALLSSVKQEIDGDIKKNNSSNTMPGRWRLQKFLHESFRAGCQYVLVEVTSQGVVQHRHKFIDWDVAVFLNLHPEHIESHGSYENYREAKLNFFRYLSKSKKDKRYFFINKEDSESAKFGQVAEDIQNGEVNFFSRDDVYKQAEKIKENKNLDWLKADFNLDNLAAATAVARSRSIDSETIWEAFNEFDGVEGRMDFIQHKPFKVLIDYAHTPDSLRALYRNLRESDDFNDDSNLICVFGSAGGGRDKWKRPELGKVAGSYCNEIILTSEDPYDEDPESIALDIQKGVLESDFSEEKISIDTNRRKAIEKAIREAQKGDTVVITGIGSQGYFHTSEGKIDWDEKEIVKETLSNK